MHIYIYYTKKQFNVCNCFKITLRKTDVWNDDCLPSDVELYNDEYY